MGTVYLCAGLLSLALLGSICVLIVLVARLPARLAALVKRERDHAATQGWTAATAELSGVIVGLRRYVDELVQRLSEHGPTLPAAPPVEADDSETTRTRPESQALPRAPELPAVRPAIRPPPLEAPAEAPTFEMEEEDFTQVIPREGTPAAAPGAPREAHAILPGQTDAPPPRPRRAPHPPPRRVGPPGEPSR